MNLTQEQRDEIGKRCEAIPGAGGWWNPDGLESYIEAAIKMVEAGFSIDDTIELLIDLFTAGKYG